MDDTVPLPPAVVAALHAATSPAPATATSSLAAMPSPTAHTGQLLSQHSQHSQQVQQPQLQSHQSQSLFALHNTSLALPALLEPGRPTHGSGAGLSCQLLSSPSGGRVPSGSLLATMASMAASPTARGGGGGSNASGNLQGGFGTSTAAPGPGSSPFAVAGGPGSPTSAQWPAAFSGSLGSAFGGAGYGSPTAAATMAGGLKYGQSPRAAPGAGQLAGYDSASLAQLVNPAAASADLLSGRADSDQGLMQQLRLPEPPSRPTLSPTTAARIHQQQQQWQQAALGILAGSPPVTPRNAAPAMPGFAAAGGEPDGAVPVQCGDTFRGWYLLKHGRIACACDACKGVHSRKPSGPWDADVVQPVASQGRDAHALDNSYTAEGTTQDAAPAQHVAQGDDGAMGPSSQISQLPRAVGQAGLAASNEEPSDTAMADARIATAMGSVDIATGAQAGPRPATAAGPDAAAAWRCWSVAGWEKHAGELRACNSLVHVIRLLSTLHTLACRYIHACSEACPYS